MKKIIFTLSIILLSISAICQMQDNHPRIYNASLYGYKPDGVFLYNVSTTNGSATITSSGAGWSSADIGKVILVNGAGAAGSVLNTTILSVTNSTTIVLGTTSSATISNDTLIYGTDNTTAIQATINAAVVYGGIAYFTRGIAIINGALNGTSNSQIYIPVPVDGQHKVTLTLTGEVVSANGGSTFNPTFSSLNQLTGSVWYSTISGSGAQPAVISSAAAGIVTRNKNDVIIKNFQMWLYTNHGANAISMTAIYGGAFQKISALYNVICPDIELTRTASPASSEVAGIVVGAINDNGSNMIQENTILGLKYGIVPAEHTNLLGNLIFGCIYGIALPGMLNTVTGQSQVFACANEVYSPNASVMGLLGGASNVDLIIESEWDTASTVVPAGIWYKSINNVSDSGNHISGRIRINIAADGVIANTGGAHVYGTNSAQLYVSTFSQVPLTATVSSTQIPVASSATAFTGSANLTFDANQKLTVGSSSNGGMFLNPSTAIRDGWNLGLEMQCNATNPNPSLMFSNQTSNTRNGGVIWTRSTSGNANVNQQAQIQTYESSNTGVMEFRANANTGTTATTTMMRIWGSTGISIGGTGFVPNSTLHNGGSFAGAYQGKGIDYTLTSTDYVVEMTVTGKIETLPTAVGITGRIYTIKLTAAGSGTVATTSSQTIDGSTTYSLSAQYKYITVMSNGSNWIIIANN